MGEKTELIEQKAGETFEAALSAVAQLPAVRIDRESFLRGTFQRRCSPAQLEKILRDGPSAAGVPAELVDKAVRDAIRWETTRVTAISTAAGIPGGIALAATIPADSAQNLAHVLRVSQKIAYLRDWPDLFDGSDMGDGTKQVLTLFVGAMFGVQGATDAIGKVAANLGAHAARTLPKKALTKGVVYPVVKKVARSLGYQMNKQIFGKSVGKAIPVIGGVVSGGLTLASFRPMAKRLDSCLAEARIPVSADTRDEKQVLDVDADEIVEPTED